MGSCGVLMGRPDLSRIYSYILLWVIHLLFAFSMFTSLLYDRPVTHFWVATHWSNGRDWQSLYQSIPVFPALLEAVHVMCDLWYTSPLNISQEWEAFCILPLISPFNRRCFLQLQSTSCLHADPFVPSDPSQLELHQWNFNRWRGGKGNAHLCALFRLCFQCSGHWEILFSLWMGRSNWISWGNSVTLRTSVLLPILIQCGDHSDYVGMCSLCGGRTKILN